MVPWKCIGVALKAGQTDLAALLERVVRPIRDRGLELALDREASAQLAEPEALTLEEVAARVDLFIVLGGAGTVLATARAIGERPVPILGINLGHLGFLADVAPSDVDGVLEQVLGGHCSVVERSRLDVRTCEGEREVDRDLALNSKVAATTSAACLLALNDAVFSKGPGLARLIDIETRVNGRWVGTYRADGLIVSTPTGSTAYNLAAGGPILAPQVAGLILTPICPHTLSLRPLVLDDASSIEVRVSMADDVQVGRHLGSIESVRITRSAHPVRFLTIPDRDHFEIVRTKLGWGSR